MQGEMFNNKNEEEEHTYEGAEAQNSLCAPASFMSIHQDNSIKFKTDVLYMNSRLKN